MSTIPLSDYQFYGIILCCGLALAATLAVLISKLNKP